jgi:AcrR family transcriptional regulator
MSREAIVHVAARLFQERGYHATSLQEVAAEFGVTRPAVYYYFRSKEELLYEIHRLAKARLLAVSEGIYELDLEPVELIRRLLFNHATTIVENAELLACFFHEETALTAERRREIKKTRADYTKAFANVYEAGVEQGEFVDRDPMLAVLLMLGACNWIVSWYRPGMWGAQQIAETASSMLVQGIRLPRAAVHAEG